MSTRRLFFTGATVSFERKPCITVDSFRVSDASGFDPAAWGEAAGGAIPTRRPSLAKPLLNVDVTVPVRRRTPDGFDSAALPPFASGLPPHSGCVQRFRRSMVIFASARLCRILYWVW